MTKMPERLERLKSALHDLEHELHGVEEIDPETRVLLEEAMQEIHTALGEQDAAAMEPQSVTDRLRAAAHEFESEHPTITGILHRMIDTLGQMGI